MGWVYCQPRAPRSPGGTPRAPGEHQAIIGEHLEVLSSQHRVDRAGETAALLHDRHAGGGI